MKVGAPAVPALCARAGCAASVSAAAKRKTMRNRCMTCDRFAEITMARDTIRKDYSASIGGRYHPTGKKCADFGCVWCDCNKTDIKLSQQTEHDDVG